MSKQTRFAIEKNVWTLLALLALAPGVSLGQQVGAQPVNVRITSATQRLEMVVNTSRILKLDQRIPELMVMNPDVVKAVPLSADQVQVSALKTGVTQVNLWDDNKKIYTIDVIVFGDARELQHLLKSEFPTAELRIRPLANSVVISGYVPSVEMVSKIQEVAEDYYPKVINNMTVGGAQTVLLHTKVMEVSRTKLRRHGFDWAALFNNDAVIQTVSGLVVSATQAAGGVSGTSANFAVGGTTSDTISFGIVDSESVFLGFLEMLRQHDLVKVLAEPTVVTTSGRPASFSSGGEFPILIPQSLGTVSVEYRQFGTRVDFVPIVLGNGHIHLEVRPQISEIDPARSVTINSTTVPGLRNRWVDTAVEMRAGQTLALAGLIQNRVEAQNKGLPYLADIPWLGTAFRRVEEQVNEIELLIFVTPEFVDAMDPHEVPAYGPGQETRSPTTEELFYKGYLEVPRCCPDGQCNQCQGGVPSGGMIMGSDPGAGHIQTYPAHPQPVPAQPQQTQPVPLPRSEPIPMQPKATGDQGTSAGRSPLQQLRNQRQYSTPYGFQSSQRRPTVPAVPTAARTTRPYGTRAPVNRKPVAPQPRSNGKIPSLMGPVGYDTIK